jgi:sigma-B regulation protein RsbU (phosphoserine phosphatase)
MLDVSTGSLEICNAGHPPPYRVTGSSKPEPLHSERNPALGLVRGFQFTTAKFDLAPGDRIFFYTDGVTEALNFVNDLYGPERLETLLGEHRQMDVELLAKSVISDVQNHSRTRDASDDITVVVVDFTGPGSDISTGNSAPPVAEQGSPQA